MEEIKIALIQADLAWEDPDKNRENFNRTLSAMDRDTDLVVLPEMFTTGFTMDPERVFELPGGPTAKWMADWAKVNNTALAGSVVIKENEVYRNRFLFVYPEGQIVHYDKRHSFTLAGEHKKYHSGTERVLIEYRGWKIFPQICYDLRFPVFSRNNLDYDLLIYVANWPAVRIDAWDTLLKARAIENMAWSIGVNRIGKDGNNYEYPGHSAIYDGLGKKIAYSSSEEVLYATLDRTSIEKARKKLGFLNDRDDFNLK